MTADTTPTLTTVEDATAKLSELAETHEWVSVFWDRGWGDSGQTAEITIDVDGNGQDPKARITPDVYKALREQNIIGENKLMTFKARRSHDYKAPPVAKREGPTANEVAEKVIRDVLTERPDWPIVAEFYRGLSRGRGGLPQVDHEYAETPARGWEGMFVMLIPGCAEVAMSAQKPSFFGPDIIGGGVADCLEYPRRGDEVDLDALAGDTFRARLVAAIEEKIAVIEAERGKR